MKRFHLSVAALLTVWSLAGLGEVVADDQPEGKKVNAAVVTVVKSESKKIRLYTQAGQPVTVALIDADGNLLYQGQVRSKTARGTSFNLNPLPDGTYYLTASNDNWWSSRALLIRNNELLVDERQHSEAAKPTLTTYAKNKFEMSMPVRNVPVVQVMIYNRQNELVYTGHHTGATRRFDLSTLPEGSYTFVAGPAEKQFTQRIDITK